MEQENPDLQFRTSMHNARPPARFGKILQPPPGMDTAAPPDMLHNVPNQEMRELAETARNLLPGEQWDRLRNAAKEDLQRKILGPCSGA